MARGYGAKKLALAQYEGDNLGMKLGSAAVRANIPMVYLAWVMDVSRITIYEWFNGGNIRKDLQGRVQQLTSVLELDLREGMLLPVKNLKAAKKYVEEMTGETFPSNTKQATN